MSFNYDQMFRMDVLRSVDSKRTWRYLANTTAIGLQLCVAQQIPCVQYMYDFVFEWF